MDNGELNKKIFVNLYYLGRLRSKELLSGFFCIFELIFVILSGKTEIFTGINDNDKRFTADQTAFRYNW